MGTGSSSANVNLAEPSTGTEGIVMGVSSDARIPEGREGRAVCAWGEGVSESGVSEMVRVTSFFFFFFFFFFSSSVVSSSLSSFSSSSLFVFGSSLICVVECIRGIGWSLAAETAASRDVGWWSV